MNTLQLTTNDRLAIIALDRGRSNPMNFEMVTELGEVIRNLENDDQISGVIITGKENFFSAGLDLIEVYDYDEEKSRDFWKEFLNLQGALTAFKKPIVAAISGHSPAGGCVLAICCDYRIMVRGKFIIGLNEIPVGIIVPGNIFDLYAFWIGRRKAYQYLLEGKLLSVDEALSDGLIDEVCDSFELLSLAEKKVRMYMQFHPITWSQSKLNLRQDLITSNNADKTDMLNMMLKQWWAPETRQTLKVIIENLKFSSPKKV
jgi:enoyl-CoA hydratase/carnithine racemase